MSNDVNNTPSHDEARQIIDALRQIQNNPELRAQLQNNARARAARYSLDQTVNHYCALYGRLMSGEARSASVLQEACG